LSIKINDPGHHFDVRGLTFGRNPLYWGKEMKFILGLLLSVSALQFAGCVGASTENSIKVTDAAPQGAEGLKKFLTDLAASGTPVGSGGMVMQSFVDQMTGADAEKAKALQPHVDAMMSLSDSAKIKAKAKEMLAILSK
jgi:hypothetical protein